MRLLRVLIVLWLAATGVLVGVTPAGASAPVYHENPVTAKWVFDGVSYLQKLSSVLTCVLNKDPESIKPLQDEASLANIPPDLGNPTASFFTSSSSLAALLPEIQQGVDSAGGLLTQSKPDDAGQVLDLTLEKLNSAYTELRSMDMAAAHAGTWWGLSAAHPSSPLYAAYGDVQAKLARLRAILDTMGLRVQAMSLQAQILSGAASGASANELENAIKALEGMGVQPDFVTKIMDSLSAGGTITITIPTLSLSASPQSAFVGDSVAFSGTLTGKDGPLGGRFISLIADGSLAQVLLTDDAGGFQGSLALPYRFDSSPVQLQAIYYPTGEDLGAYLGASSPVVSINLLSYAATVTLNVPKEVYPGKAFDVEGAVDYGSSPAPAGRNMVVLWDNNVVAQQEVGETFTIEVPVDQKEAPGLHKVSVYAPAIGRYAPWSADAASTVARIALVVDAHAQPLLLLPASLKVSGTVTSRMGPPDNAMVNIRLANWQTSTRTRADGTFEADLGTGLSLALVGGQQLSIDVSPPESWYQPKSMTFGVMVISPVNIACLALALLALAFLAIRWAGGRLRFASQLSSEPVIIGEAKEPALKPEQKEGLVADGPRGFVLALYREVLRLVQGVTAIALGPNVTLREFARDSAPKLGPLARYFREFTLLVERLLYSRHSPEDKDVAKGKELGARLKEGLKSEDS